METRFQLITAPTEANIFLIIGSGARSLIFPTNTVITGPTVSGVVDAVLGAAVGGCVVFGNGNGCCVFVGPSCIGAGRAYSCGPDLYAFACDGGGWFIDGIDDPTAD